MSAMIPVIRAEEAFQDAAIHGSSSGFMEQDHIEAIRRQWRKDLTKLDPPAPAHQLSDSQKIVRNFMFNRNFMQVRYHAPAE